MKPAEEKTSAVAEEKQGEKSPEPQTEGQSLISRMFEPSTMSDFISDTFQSMEKSMEEMDKRFRDFETNFFKPLPQLNELMPIRTHFFDDIESEWNRSLKEFQENKPISSSTLSKFRPMKLFDDHLKEVENFIGKKFNYSGSMLKDQPHGPGTMRMEGGVVQYEGNWVNGKMVGKGYMTTFDNDGNIQRVCLCDEGHPVKELCLPGQKTFEERKMPEVEGEKEKQPATKAVGHGKQQKGGRGPAMTRQDEGAQIKPKSAEKPDKSAPAQK